MKSQRLSPLERRRDRRKRRPIPCAPGGFFGVIVEPACGLPAPAGIAAGAEEISPGLERRLVIGFGRASTENRQQTGSRLSYIDGWGQRARAASYSVALMAKDCGVSIRTLERFFNATISESSRRWLKRLRMQHALDLFRAGKTVKEAYELLGYKNPNQLSEDFKKIFGASPMKRANSHYKYGWPWASEYVFIGRRECRHAEKINN